MKNHKGFLGLFLAVLVFLPGCLHVPTYRSRSLQSVSEHCAYRGFQKNVVVRAKCLSQAEKSYLFNGRSALIDDELHAIYLSIHNLGKTPYTFSYDSIQVKQVKSSDVTRSMKKTSSVGRLCGSALFAYPSLPIVTVFAVVGVARIEIVPIVIACCGSLIAGGMIGGLVALGIVGTGFSIAFLAQGIKSIVMNRRMHKDLIEKILHEPVVIKSGEQYEGPIFVKTSDYQSEFSVTMRDQNDPSNMISFDVDLQSHIEHSQAAI